MKKIFSKLVIIFLVLFSFSSTVLADTLEERVFYVDPSFSENSLNYTLRAEKVLEKNGLEMYIDSKTYNTKTEEEKREIEENLLGASERFKKNQEKVISLFGREAYPGIDNNTNIIILLYPLKQDARGYIRVIDKYERILAPLSNESEIVYLDVDKIDSPFFDAFLIHEYTHLIFLNQKKINKAFSEENVWLAELYSEYAATTIEDEGAYKYFDQRIKDFFRSPSTSLTQWTGDISDYAVITLFAHYIADNYGEDVLSESMKLNNNAGIESLELALKRRGHGETLEEVFKNFVIAVAINDCSSNSKYCFKNERLKDFKVLPFNNFLPFSGKAFITIGQSLENWSAQWQKFTGGTGEVEIVFDGQDDSNIEAKYIAKTKKGRYIVGDLELNEHKKGKVVVPYMDEDYESIVIIPIMADKSASSNSYEKFNYEIKAKAVFKEEESEPVDKTLENVFNLNKPLSEMSQRELLILLIRILLLKQDSNL